MSVFISYSRKDSEWLEEVKIPLKFLEAKKEIKFWDDTKINEGLEWEKEINHFIKNCSVALLLVSGNFLSSTFILEKELPKILAKASKKGVIIYTIILDHCMFSSTELSKYQSFNKPSEPLEDIHTSDRKKLLVTVAQKIESILLEKNKTHLNYNFTFQHGIDTLIILSYLAKKQHEKIQISDIDKALTLKRKRIYEVIVFLEENQYICKGEKKEKSPVFWRILPLGLSTLSSFEDSYEPTYK